MANISNVCKITRKASGPAARFIAVHQPSSNPKVKFTTRLLGTKITKVELPEKYAKMHKGQTVPIEQYAFKVDDRIVLRFADATAIVLKKHHVDVDLGKFETRQVYLVKALEILAGKEPLKDVTADMASAAEAKAKPAPVAEPVAA